MIEVRVCLGSSCHIKGGAQTLKVFKALIESNDLSEKVELAADLCQENCLKAPNVVVDGVPFGGITPDRAAAFFQDYVISVVKTDAGSGDNND